MSGPLYTPCPYDDFSDCPEEGDHNPNGDHYGCACDECMQFYRSLKR
jgi:hypothetical protein